MQSFRKTFSTKKEKPKGDKRLPKITINMYDDESKYHGKPLIEPKIPYQYEVKLYKSDPNLNFIQNAVYRLQFMVNSLYEYLSDILHWRKEPIAFKTSEFVVRNFNRGRALLAHLVHEVKQISKGIQKLKNDVMFATGVSRKKHSTKYNKSCYRE